MNSLRDSDWTNFQIEAEVEHYGTSRIVHEHNDLRNELEDVKRQRDMAIRHIAEWCVAIDVNGGGWDDWDEYYKDAYYRDGRLSEIRGLLNEAIEAEKKRRGIEE